LVFLEDAIVNNARPARSEKGRARKRTTAASPSETVVPESAELERLSAEQNQEVGSMSDNTASNAIKLVSEGLITPGASLLLDGDIRRGGAHVLVGLAARALLGPVGWVLVAANSFSRSTTGRSLSEQFTPRHTETPANRD
jgi:hypothetical protein